MSFVGVCSVIYSLEDNSEGVKVIDLSNIWEYMQKEDIGFSRFIGVDKKDESKYPYICFKYLYGFSSYPISDDVYRFESLGVEYNEDSFIDFWSHISKCTEPFYFYHSPYDGAFRTVVDVLQSMGDYVYKVVCVNGKVEVYKKEIKEV